MLLWLLSPQFLLIALLVGIEWSTRRGSHALERLPRSVFMRWGLYAMITFAILLNIDLHAPHAFIYFQF
ncbi:MAG: hypothetical protein KDB84_03235 [Flavobacteriales bacterium]|nr:hypothetical protein [Flavobacteriales bacterium]